MGMDRNTVIGFVLLAILLFLYLYTSNRNSQDLAIQKKIYEDSMAKITAARNTTKDTVANTSTLKDTTGISNALSGEQQTFTVENNVMQIVFSNKGGQPESVKLKNYQSFDNTPVQLISNADKISYPVNISASQSFQTTDLLFSPGQVDKNADGSQTVTFRLKDQNGGMIAHEYIVQPDNYAISWNIQVNGVDRLFSQRNLNIIWHAQPVKHQQDVKYERELSNVGFYEDNDFDYISNKSEKNLRIRFNG